MKTIKYYLLLALLISVSSASFCQDETGAPPVKTVKVSDNLYVITVYYVNMLVSSGSDGVLIVDSGYEQGADALLAEIKKLGKEKIDYIINTHWHFDHCEGNLVFGRDAVIVSHSKVKELLSEDRFLLGDTIKAYPDYALPEITFDDKYEMVYNGDTIRLISYSGGHSAGDIAVHFVNDNIIHIGDIVFSDMFSFIDTDHGGSIVTLSENIRKILDYIPENIKIITGHGRIYGKNDLMNHLKMIESTTGIIKKEIEKGRKLEEIQSNDVLKEYSEWGKAFKSDRWIEFIYLSLLKEK